MDPPSAPPPRAPSPLLARLFAPPGPPSSRWLVHAGSDARVLVCPGRYSVSYLLVEPGGVVVVECGSEADVETVLAGLRWLGRAPTDVRCVVPTHLHFDHCMGVDPLARRLDAPVCLGRVAADHVAASRPIPFPRGLPVLRALPTWPMQGLPLFTRGDWSQGMGFGFPWSKNGFSSPLGPPLSEGDPLPGLDGWRVMETPGHAPDAISLHHPGAGWLVAGDTLRNFLGGEWNPLLTDPAAYRSTRSRLAALPVRLILPGHGPVFAPPLGGLAALSPRPWYHP